MLTITLEYLIYLYPIDSGALLPRDVSFPRATRRTFNLLFNFFHNRGNRALPKRLDEWQQGKSIGGIRWKLGRFNINIVKMKLRSSFKGTIVNP